MVGERVGLYANRQGRINGASSSMQSCSIGIVTLYGKDIYMLFY